MKGGATVKLYRFYRNGKDEKSDMSVYEKYPLYAVTSDKEIAKKFEKSRRKDYFIKKVSKVSKDEGIAYLNSHRKSMLDWFALRTVDYSEKINHVVMDMLMTEFEYDLLQANHDDLSPILEKTYADPHIFNKDIYNQLTVIGYLSAFLLVDVNDAFDGDFETVATYLEDIDLDEVVLFIHMVDDQLSAKGVSELVRLK